MTYPGYPPSHHGYSGQQYPPQQPPQHTGQHRYGPPQWSHQPQQQWPTAPAPKKRKWPWIVGGVVGFFVLVGSCGGNNSAPTTSAVSAGAVSSVTQVPAVAAPPTPAPEPSRPDPTVIKVKQMGDDFEANQLAAEKKWGGQYVQFTAPVGNINSFSVSFQDVTTKFSFTQVSCRFEDESAVLNLAKDKPATVRGIVGEDQLLGVISLNECEIVS
jgi:hypothetical protein